MGSGFLSSFFLTMFSTISFVSPADTEENVVFVQVAACAYICEMTHGYENEVNSSQSTFSVHLVSDSFTFLPEVPRPHPLHA